MNKPFNLEAAVKGEELVIVCGSPSDVYHNKRFVVTGFEPNYYGNRTLLATDVDPNASYKTLHIQFDGKITWVGRAEMAPKKVKKTVYVNVYGTNYSDATVFTEKASAEKALIPEPLAKAVPITIEVEE